LSSRVTHSRLSQIHAATAEYWSRTPLRDQKSLPLWIADVTLEFARHAIDNSSPRLEAPGLAALWRVLDEGARSNSSDMPFWFAYLETALHMSERMLGARLAKSKSGGTPVRIEELRLRGRPCGAYSTPHFIVDSVLDDVFGIHSTTRALDILDLSVEAGHFPVSIAAQAPDRARINFFAVDRDPIALRLTRKLFTFASAHAVPGRTKLFLSCRDSLLEALPSRWPKQYDVVLGNPPWAGSRNAYNRGIKDVFAPRLSHNFDLYLAFILRAAQYVKPGGTLAFVIPSTLLFNDSAQPTREYILEHFDVVSIRLFPRRSFIEVPCLIPISIVLSKKTAKPTQSSQTLIAYHPHKLGGASRPRTSSKSFASQYWNKNDKKCFHPLVGARYEKYLRHFEAMPPLNDFGDVLGAAKLENENRISLKTQFLGFHARDIRSFHACRRDCKTYEVNGGYFAIAPQDSHIRGRKVVFQNFRYMTHERRLVAATLGAGEYGVSTAAQFCPDEQKYTDFYTALLNSTVINSWFKLRDVSRAIKLAHVREIPVAFDEDLVQEVNTTSRRCNAIYSQLHVRFGACNFNRDTPALRAETPLISELRQNMVRMNELIFDLFQLSTSQRRLATEISSLRVF
jgi:tRNA1(Val) A37 N6-methylase TrmN6